MRPYDSESFSSEILTSWSTNWHCWRNRIRNASGPALASAVGFPLPLHNHNYRRCRYLSSTAALLRCPERLHKVIYNLTKRNKKFKPNKGVPSTEDLPLWPPLSSYGFHFSKDDSFSFTDSLKTHSFSGASHEELKTDITSLSFKNDLIFG